MTITELAFSHLSCSLTFLAPGLFTSRGFSDVRDYLVASNLVDGAIDLVIISHAHVDHYGGLRYVLDAFEVNELWDPGFESDSVAYRRYLNIIQDGVSRVHRPLREKHLPAVDNGSVTPFTLSEIPDVQFTVLQSPDPTEAGSDQPRPNYNNTSIVVIIEIDGFRMLFPGDAEAEREQALVALSRTDARALSADTVLAPHHGSTLASTQPFIDAVDPRIVLFSAAQRFGNPRANVIARYNKAPRRLLRTDRHAAASTDNIVVTVFDDRSTRYRFLQRVEDGPPVWVGKLPDDTQLTQVNSWTSSATMGHKGPGFKETLGPKLP